MFNIARPTVFVPPKNLWSVRLSPETPASSRRARRIRPGADRTGNPAFQMSLSFPFRRVEVYASHRPLLAQRAAVFRDFSSVSSVIFALPRS